MALVAIALLSSLKGTGGPPIGESLALLFAKLILFALAMFVFAKTVLLRVFRVLAPSREPVGLQIVAPATIGYMYSSMKFRKCS